MNSRADQSRDPSSNSDIAKYAVAILLAVGGVVAFYWFENQWSNAVRVLAVVAGLTAALVVFLNTTKGLQTREFLSEARFELRKVVWPTRQEALRMTWVVMIVVVIISLMLAGFDFIIQRAVRLLLGT